MQDIFEDIDSDFDWTPAEVEVERAPEPSRQEYVDYNRGFIGDIGHEVTSGIVQGMDRYLAAASQYELSGPGWFTAARDWVRSTAISRPDLSAYTGNDSFLGTLRGDVIEPMIASATAAIPGAYAGAKAGALAGPWGALAGGAIGGALTSTAVVFGSTLKDGYEEADREGLTGEDREDFAYNHAYAESAPEALGQLVTLGAGGAAAKAGLTTAKGIIKGLKANKGNIQKLIDTGLKTNYKGAALGVVGGSLVEGGTEIATEALQNENRELYGIEKLETNFAYTGLVGTLAGGGPSVVSTGLSLKETKAKYEATTEALNSKNPDIRRAAIDEVYKNTVGTLPEQAELFREYGYEQVKHGGNIKLAESFDQVLEGVGGIRENAAKENVKIDAELDYQGYSPNTPSPLLEGKAPNDVLADEIEAATKAKVAQGVAEIEEIGVSTVDALEAGTVRERGMGTAPAEMVEGPSTQEVETSLYSPELRDKVAKTPAQAMPNSGDIKNDTRTAYDRTIEYWMMPKDIRDKVYGTKGISAKTDESLKGATGTINWLAQEESGTTEVEIKEPVEGLKTLLGGTNGKAKEVVKDAVMKLSEAQAIAEEAVTMEESIEAEKSVAKVTSFISKKVESGPKAKTFEEVLETEDTAVPVVEDTVDKGDIKATVSELYPQLTEEQIDEKLSTAEGVEEASRLIDESRVDIETKVADIGTVVDTLPDGVELRVIESNDKGHIAQKFKDGKAVKEMFVVYRKGQEGDVVWAKAKKNAKKILEIGEVGDLPNVHKFQKVGQVTKDDRVTKRMTETQQLTYDSYVDMYELMDMTEMTSIEVEARAVELVALSNLVKSGKKDISLENIKREAKAVRQEGYRKATETTASQQEGVKQSGIASSQLELEDSNVGVGDLTQAGLQRDKIEAEFLEGGLELNEEGEVTTEADTTVESTEVAEGGVVAIEGAPRDLQSNQLDIVGQTDYKTQRYMRKGDGTYVLEHTKGDNYTVIEPVIVSSEIEYQGKPQVLKKTTFLVKDQDGAILGEYAYLDEAAKSTGDPIFDMSRTDKGIRPEFTGDVVNLLEEVQVTPAITEERQGSVITRKRTGGDRKPAGEGGATVEELEIQDHEIEAAKVRLAFKRDILTTNTNEILAKLAGKTEGVHGDLIQHMLDNQVDTLDNVKILPKEEYKGRHKVIPDNFYDPDSGNIYINMKQYVARKDGIDTLVHELKHAITHGKLRSDSVFNDSITALRLEAIRKANLDLSNWTAIKAATDTKRFNEEVGNEWYGLLDNDEFLAHATNNKKFLKFLDSTRAEGLVEESLLDMLWNAIRKIFGNVQKGSLLDAALMAEEVSNALEVTEVVETDVTPALVEEEVKLSFQEQVEEDLKEEANLENRNKILRAKDDITKRLSDWTSTHISGGTDVLRAISPRLESLMNKFEARVNLKTKERMKVVDTYEAGVKKMSEEDKARWLIARRNSNSTTERKIAEDIEAKYKINTEKMQKVLDEIGTAMVAKGLLTKVKKGYFPTVVKDVQGLMDYLRQDQPAILQSMEADLRAKGLDPTIENIEKAYQDALITGSYPAMLSLPGAAKKKSIHQIDVGMSKFYEEPIMALRKTIAEGTEAIEQREVIGKSGQASLGRRLKKATGLEAKLIADQLKAIEVEKDLSISAWVAREAIEDNIDPKDQQRIKEVFQARFNQKGVTKGLGAVKDIQLAIALGTGFSTITQLGDAALVARRYGMKAMWKGMSKVWSGDTTLEDTYDFQGHLKDPDDLSRPTAKYLDAVLKYSGFAHVDRFFKGTAMEASLDKAREMTKEEFTKKYSSAYGPETDQLFEDINSGEGTDLVKYFAFNELAQLQPIASSRMPEAYMRGGNWRLMYALKSFTLTQMNNLVRDAKEGSTKGESLRRVASGIAMLSLAGASTSCIKKALRGEWCDFEEETVDNMMKIFFVSRYDTSNLSSEGFGGLLEGMFSPPMDVLDKPFGDFLNLIDGDTENNTFETLGNFPVLGAGLYQWLSEDAREKVEKRNKERD